MRQALILMALFVIAISLPNEPAQPKTNEPIVYEDTYTEEPIEETIEVYEETYTSQAYTEPITYVQLSESDAKEAVASFESGGDYEATNGRYIGRYQLDAAYLDGDYSVENQEATADAYVADRYGSWSAAYEHIQGYGWY